MSEICCLNWHFCLCQTFVSNIRFCRFTTFNMAEGDILNEEQKFNGSNPDGEEAMEVEPNFDDPEGYVDDVKDEGILLLSFY